MGDFRQASQTFFEFFLVLKGLRDRKTSYHWRFWVNMDTYLSLFEHSQLGIGLT